MPGLEKGFQQAADPATKRMCGLQLMRTYTGLQRDQDAVTVALELNRLYPNDPEILYHTGRIYGNYAFLTFHQLEVVAPTSIWRHQAAAEAFESEGSTDSGDSRISRGTYTRSSPAEYPLPHRPDLAGTLAAYPYTLKTQTQAAQEFEQELQLDPAMPTPATSWPRSIGSGMSSTRRKSSLKPR